MNVEDFHSRLKELYLPQQNQFTLVQVPEIRYAVVDGQGNLEDGGFPAAIKWLYSIVYFVKPLVKERLGGRFVEPPLECLYWSDPPRKSARTDGSGAS
jgi:hypothetical protein